MRGSRGAAAVAACALALVAAPGANASQGSDTVTRWDYVLYNADPGEANRFTAVDYDLGLHMRDAGAIIRWIPSECTAAVHDVFCVDRSGGFMMDVRLGDRNDTFENRSSWPAEVQLGPGNDRATGGGVGYLLDGGPGSDDLRGGPVNAFPNPFVGQAVTYASATGPVSVSADNIANDGTSGEGDNVHSDVHEVDASPFGDTVSGFASERGGAGDDVLTGSGGADSVYGEEGNDDLTGGAGSDTLVDAYGDNVFHARDGEVDHVSCSSGHDTVFADPQDVIEAPAAGGFGGACDDVQVG